MNRDKSYDEGYDDGYDEGQKEFFNDNTGGVIGLAELLKEYVGLSSYKLDELAEELFIAFDGKLGKLK